MSRLESFIRRMLAQKACLDHVCARIAGVPGPVLEFGLGNGRTYDHLREKLPDREIYVFDRQVSPHPSDLPPERYLILGDIPETVRTALPRIGAPAALMHLDLGAADPTATASLLAALAPDLVTLLAVGGLIAAADAPVTAPGLRPLPLPDGVPAGRYFLYERTP